MYNNTQDKLFASYQSNTQEFQFNEAVANVFSDMIKRSVPGYENIINMIGIFAQTHAKNGSVCYDLGCSLGASTAAILSNLGDKNCHVIGVDNSSAMATRCKQNLDKLNVNHSYEIICQDILDTDIQNASLVILNFTLQFIPKAEREKLLQRIYDALIPGGILLLSEKITFNNAQKDALFTELHHAFKKTQGYSDLEISQKRTALENVLIPEASDTHLHRLHEVGFHRCDLWFQCLNFASYFAIK